MTTAGIAKPPQGAAAASAETCEPAATPAPRPGRRRLAVASGDQLFLSVFLMLMAFFALLVALSSFETRRVRMVFDSLAQSFATVQEDDHTAAPDARENALSGPERMRRELEEALPVRIDVAGADGDVFRLTLASAWLFEPDGALVRRSRHVMLGRIAAALAGGTGYRLEIIGPPGGRARLAALASRLVALGAPAGSLAVGVDRHRRSGWLLRFMPAMGESADAS